MDISSCLLPELQQAGLQRDMTIHNVEKHTNNPMHSFFKLLFVNTEGES